MITVRKTMPLSNPDPRFEYLYDIPRELKLGSHYDSRCMRDYYRALRWPVEKFDSSRIPEVNTEVYGSLFARSYLATITLYNRDGGVFAELFAKVHHPGKKLIPTSSGLENLTYKARFEHKTLTYWNSVGLPSPFYFGMTEHDVAVVGSSTPRKAYTILMKRVHSPTHDQDFLAINQHVALYKRMLKDNFISAELKTNLEANITQLKEEQDTLIKSILQTQVRCQLLGTYHLRDTAQQIRYVPRRPNLVFEEHRRHDHYLRFYHLFQLVSRGDLPLHCAQRNRFQTDQQLTDHKERQAKFRILFEPLFHYLYADRGTYRYIHGDGYPHNYAASPLREGEALLELRRFGKPIEFTSVMFSPNRAKLGLPVEDLAKTLLSPILNLSSSEIDSFVHYYYNLVPEIINKYKDGKRTRPGIEQLVLPQSLEEFHDTFDLMGYHILQKGFGLKGKDQISNKESYEFLSSEPKPYRHADSMVNFPESPITSIRTAPFTIDYTPYTTESAIPVLERLLRERLEAFTQRSSERSAQQGSKVLEETVKRLSDRFVEYSYLSS